MKKGDSPESVNPDAPQHSGHAEAGALDALLACANTICTLEHVSDGETRMALLAYATEQAKTATAEHYKEVGQRVYPCGCSASPANVPDYCPTHGSPFENEDGCPNDPDRWVLVPNDPTDAMLKCWMTPGEQRGGTTGADTLGYVRVIQRYRAMLAAAPRAPAPTKESAAAGCATLPDSAASTETGR